MDCWGPLVSVNFLHLKIQKNLSIIKEYSLPNTIPGDLAQSIWKSTTYPIKLSSSPVQAQNFSIESGWIYSRLCRRFILIARQEDNSDSSPINKSWMSCKLQCRICGGSNPKQFTADRSQLPEVTSGGLLPTFRSPMIQVKDHLSPENARMPDQGFSLLSKKLLDSLIKSAAHLAFMEQNEGIPSELSILLLYGALQG